MTLRAPSVLLGPPPEKDDEPRWCQIGCVGAWRGHPTGPFELTLTDLQQIVANFRGNPAYTPAPNFSRVVAFDFHHASEQRPAELGMAGAPAQAWALELEVRGDQLWALVDYLEPARTYVREGRYRWVSMALSPHGVDPVSGEDCGWMLSSIALTNDPFIQGMVPLAASRGAATEMQIMADELRKVLAKGLGCDEADVERVALERHKKLVALEADAGPEAQLKAILGALGVEDQDGAMKRIVGLLQSAAALNEAMPQLAEYAASQAGAEEAAVEEEVEQAMQAHRLPPAAKAALKLMRTGGAAVAGLTGAELRKALAARKAAREAFLREYPLPAPKQAHLLQRVAAEPTQQPAATAVPSVLGRNDFERAMASARAANPTLTFEQAHELVALSRRN